MRAVKANLVWAHMIIARVKLRLWTYAGNAVHVYVDSLITPDTLTTGDGLGEWRLERSYEHGVFVGGPGHYGPTPHNIEKHAGSKRDA